MMGGWVMPGFFVSFVRLGRWDTVRVSEIVGTGWLFVAWLGPGVFGANGFGAPDGTDWT